MRLFDSELHIMTLLWENGALNAKEIAERLSESVGWSKTTTYTVLQKCVKKGIVGREDPGYICRALLSKDAVAEDETDAVIDRLYGGAPDLLIASLLGRGKLSAAEIRRLREMVEQYEAQ